MRIIAGQARGRRLFTPDGQGSRALIRPTSDRAREALFSILGAAVQDALVLDLFAGTGAIGLEALSRGARRSVFVDMHQPAINLIRRNVELCGFVEQATVLRHDLQRGLGFLKQFSGERGFDLLFLDPPYRKGLGEQLLTELGRGELVHEDSLVVVEESDEIDLQEAAGRLFQFDRRRYGDTAFWFYEVRQP